MEIAVYAVTDGAETDLVMALNVDHAIEISKKEGCHYETECQLWAYRLTDEELETEIKNNDQIRRVREVYLDRIKDERPFHVIGSSITGKGGI